MAKELPYFKFEPSQWENGKIQICSFEAQGIFINVCSMYWQRLGDLPYKLAVQKICKGNATAFDSLIEDHIVKVIDGMICIDFLNDQLLEFDNLSKVNSVNARLGWEKRRKDATAKRPNSDPNAIRGDESRGDEKKGDESEARVLKNFVWYKGQFDEMYLETLSMTHKGKDLDQAILESYAHLAADKHRLKNADQSDCKKLLNTWLTNQKNRSNGTDKQTANLAANIQAFQDRWADKG